MEEQYSRALRKHRVSSRRTGHWFIWGMSDVNAGHEAARSYLRIQEDGLPRLLVFRDRMKSFHEEIKRYRYQARKSGQVTEKVDPLCASHAMDCFRYLAMFQPKFARSDGRSSRKTGMQVVLKERQARDRQLLGTERDPIINLGPGS